MSHSDSSGHVARRQPPCRLHAHPRWPGRSGRAIPSLDPRASTASILAALVLLVAALDARAASPSPAAPPGGDPRSAGAGPGLIGDPLMAITVVLAIGVAAALATYLYVRLTSGRLDGRAKDDARS